MSNPLYCLICGTFPEFECDWFEHWLYERELELAEAGATGGAGK